MVDLTDDRATYGTARAARFAKTAAAAASSRPPSDDHVPWTHAPARDAEQGRSALGRWLRRWLGLGASADDGSGDRASNGGHRPEVPSTRRRRQVGEAAALGPTPETTDALPQVIPRRPGSQTRAQRATSGDDGDDLTDDPRLGRHARGTREPGDPVIRPTRRVRATADQVIRPGRPPQRRTLARGD
jgi:hypothetical protein